MLRNRCAQAVALSVGLLLVGAWPLPLSPTLDRRGQNALPAEAVLEERGSFRRERSDETPATIRIVSYNVHLGKRLERVLELFRTHPELSRADVIALQEVVRERQLSHARLLAERLGFDYVYLPGKRKGGREIGLALLSRYPLLDVERIVLPQQRRPNDLPRVALGATIELGAVRLRIYNLHVQALVPVELKVKQVEAALERALRHPTPCRLLLGDLNTLTRGDRRALDRRLREAGFIPALPESPWTYRRFFIRMTLDAIYVQNLQVLNAGVAHDAVASDHRPVWADVSLLTCAQPDEPEQRAGSLPSAHSSPFDLPPPLPLR
ncbi:hypothetical protein HRbin10_02523 [bacterium HR10]|nr:hypothetical protein HRbin10_02523 [bacterium HR10]